jgi:hypothetical protein
MFFFIQAGISTGCVGENRWNLPGAAVFFVVLIHLNKNPDEFQATTRRTLMIFRGLNPAFL